MLQTTKRTTETIGLADKLNDLRRLAFVIGVGIEGLGCEHPAADGLTELAFQLGDKLEELSDEVHPNGTGKPDIDEEPKGRVRSHEGATGAASLLARSPPHRPHMARLVLHGEGHGC
jgi:hypothetical protein